MNKIYNILKCDTTVIISFNTEVKLNSKNTAKFIASSVLVLPQKQDHPTNPEKANYSRQQNTRESIITVNDWLSV